MEFLSREEILARAGAQVIESVEVPELGGAVRVKALNGSERDRFEVALAGDQKAGRLPENIRARLVALAVVGQDGAPLFRPADVEELGRVNAAALDRIFEVAKRLAGIGETDVQEMRANFPPGPNGPSTSS